MTSGFTAEDIRQMSEQGDLRAFMRSRMLRPKEQREFPEAVPPRARLDGFPVGAWPAGAHRPGCPVFGTPSADGCHGHGPA